MKKHLSLLLGTSLLSFHPALAQDSSPAPAPALKETSPLQRFDLDFPGGTPWGPGQTAKSRLTVKEDVVVSPSALRVEAPAFACGYGAARLGCLVDGGGLGGRTSSSFGVGDTFGVAFFDILKQ